MGKNAEDFIVIELPDDASELQRIERKLDHLLKGQLKIEGVLTKIMATQTDIDNLAKSENDDLAAIATDLGSINDAIVAQQKAFADFVANLPAGVDITALQTAQSGLDAATASLGGVATAIGGIVTP